MHMLLCVCWLSMYEICWPQKLNTFILEATLCPLVVKNQCASSQTLKTASRKHFFRNGKPPLKCYIILLWWENLFCCAWVYIFRHHVHLLCYKSVNSCFGFLLFEHLTLHDNWGALAVMLPKTNKEIRNSSDQLKAVKQHQQTVAGTKDDRFAVWINVWI